MLLMAPLNASHLSARLHLQRNKVHSPVGDAALLGGSRVQSRGHALWWSAQVAEDGIPRKGW